jgi:hypothetical protein
MSSIKAAGANTVATLNGHFKEIYADKIKDLVPEGMKMLKLAEFSAAEKLLGNVYHQPIVLGLEHGFTYGGSAGEAFLLNAAVASPNRDAQVKGHELVLVSAISVGAASRSISSKAAFEQETKRLVQNMLKSTQIRMEIQLMYGQSGIGKVAIVAGNLLTICASEWAAGIWSGSKNAAIEIRSSTGTLRGTCNVVKPDLKNQTVEVDAMPAGVSGNVDSENAAADVIYFKGAYNKEFAGLHKIITNEGILFNVDAAEFDLFKGNVVNVGTSELAKAFISFEKIEESIALCMEKGLTEEDVVCLVNPKHWNKLMTDQAAKRQYDSSYSSEKMEQGSKSLVFYGQNGKIEIHASLFVKEGFAYVFPPAELERIGSSDITFERPGFPGKFFKEMEQANGYELRAYSDQALFTSAPGKMAVLKYIKTA